MSVYCVAMVQVAGYELDARLTNLNNRVTLVENRVFLTRGRQ